MAKQKSIAHILGMITVVAIILAVWACTSGNPVHASGIETQDVRLVNYSWDPIHVKIVE